MRLSSGTTIADVYSDFCERAYGGSEEAVRSRDELRTVIQTAGLRYRDCARLSVSDAWACGESDDDGAEVADDPNSNAARAARGRPVVRLSLPADVVDWLRENATPSRARSGGGVSALVEEIVRERMQTARAIRAAEGT